MYAGKARSGQKRGHKKFEAEYGGSVFNVNLVHGNVDERTEQAIRNEVDRLRVLRTGPHSELRGTEDQGEP